MKHSRVQEGWMCFKKGIVKYSRADCPQVWKAQGKRPASLNREFRLEFRGKKENLSSLEERSGNVGGL